MLARALHTAKAVGLSSLELVNAQQSYISQQGWKLFSTAVLCPSMGESITEGSISAVLKQPGDSIQENEVIAQIETDKVVIDVKAPEAGVLERVLVKEEDVVIPGTPIAYMKAGPAASISPTTSSATDAPSPADTSTSSISAAAVTPARRPGISFPARMTHDGKRLSSMPAAEAATYLQQVAASNPTTAPAAPSAQPALEPKAPPVSAEPARRAVSMRITSAPPRSELNAREMEAIELGGAMP